MAGPVDGVGAIEQIKAFRPHIRSIILTGYTDLDVPVRAARIQADDYLFKPVPQSQLLDVVRLTLDRESGDLGYLARFFQATGDLAHKVFSRVFEDRLTELIQTRERCLQRFFVLLRSGRLSAEDAYSAYIQLLETESQYYQARPSDWAKIPAAYAALDEKILSLIAKPTPTSRDNPLLNWNRFYRLYQILRAGEVTAAQFQQSGILLLDPALRRVNLDNYITYQKLWGTPEIGVTQADDPLLGKTFGEYTLRKRLPEYTEVPVYSALNDSGERRMVMAFPLSDVQELIQAEIQSGRVSSLGQHHGFDLVLFLQQDQTLRHYLPADGLSPAEAWTLLRPVFLQVQKYHEQGVYSGRIRLEDIRVLPGQPAFLTSFSPYHATVTLREAHKPPNQCRTLHGDVPPEIFFGLVQQLIPASDQAALSFLFYRATRGQQKMTPLFFWVSTHAQNPPRDDSPWKDLDAYPALRAVLFKMASYNHQERYSSLKDAIADLDQVFSQGSKEFWEPARTEGLKGP